MSKLVEMDMVCETASEIVDYIWFNILHHAHDYNHTIEAENGDYIYRDEAQDIFNSVLDIIDHELNGEAN